MIVSQTVMTRKLNRLHEQAASGGRGAAAAATVQSSSFLPSCSWRCEEMYSCE